MIGNGGALSRKEIAQVLKAGNVYSINVIDFTCFFPSQAFCPGFGGSGTEE